MIIRIPVGKGDSDTKFIVIGENYQSNAMTSPEEFLKLGKSAKATAYALSHASHTYRKLLIQELQKLTDNNMTLNERTEVIDELKGVAEKFFVDQKEEDEDE